MTTQTSKNCQFTSWVVNCTIIQLYTHSLVIRVNNKFFAMWLFSVPSHLDIKLVLKNGMFTLANISRGLGKSRTFGFFLLCLCNDDEKYTLSQLTGPEWRRNTWNRAQSRSINPQLTQSYDHQRHSYRLRLH